MFKWLLNIFTPKYSERELMIMKCVQELEEIGAYLVITERGGWRLEFKSPEAREAYYKQMMDKFRGKVL